jgi:hypothetical protein
MKKSFQFWRKDKKMLFFVRGDIRTALVEAQGRIMELERKLKEKESFIERQQKEGEDLIKEITAQSKSGMHFDFAAQSRAGRTAYCIERHAGAKTEISSLSTNGQSCSDLFKCDLETHERIVKEFREFCEQHK